MTPKMACLVMSAMWLVAAALDVEMAILYSVISACAANICTTIERINK